MATFIGFLSSPLSPTINHTVPYILANRTLSYLLASRHWKQYYGFDHNESPRYDIEEYGKRMVQEGKLTRRQLDRVKRVQSAQSNSIEHFGFFWGCIVRS
ncbi:faf79501-636d-4f1f-96bd-863a202b5ebd-CDS [Sclerotinia trifoliorum]|uniref:Faf79501-636d-4f1f-96bd-863a202b5ebd-CDS n=1 Tax=Sclerotinia trifoliorum TaxID=28548 RepID=A0A8H2ZP13_9HELO|nr:faf79501-636d-4f1f-96bd-863a202b5ebd-CDS [Sclerotinia trifoliorum]